jgi:hypothetical protein
METERKCGGDEKQDFANPLNLIDSADSMSPIPPLRVVTWQRRAEVLTHPKLPCLAEFHTLNLSAGARTSAGIVMRRATAPSGVGDGGVLRQRAGEVAGGTGAPRVAPSWCTSVRRASRSSAGAGVGRSVCDHGDAAGAGRGAADLDQGVAPDRFVVCSRSTPAGSMCRWGSRRCGTRRGR